jgi:hypothetical protein
LACRLNWPRAPMAASDLHRAGLRLALFLIVVASAPAVQAQSAGEVERCFQNPAVCATAPAPGPAPAPVPPSGGVVAARPAPDYASVLQRPDAERRRIQESLRTLDKYPGPIDGNLQSEGTVKAIGDWQRGRGAAATGKLTPEEVQVLHAEAARAPIKRIEPPAVAATPAPPSNADRLKSLQAQLAERRRVAEPKANAAADALIKDLKVFVAADGKSGVVADQFASFATWYRDMRAAGRTVGGLGPAVEDYGDAKAGAALTVEVRFEVVKPGEKPATQCLMFAWVQETAGTMRKQGKAFSCDDVSGVERWKSEQVLRSAWR